MASILAGASNVTISGGTFSIHQDHSNTIVHTSAFDKLSAASAHTALHNAPARTDESRCHPHTRIKVLDHMERWAQGICDEGASVFWLHGGAGAGKSAIMQSLAERCAAQGLALGCFFFSRNDPTRNNAEILIPTLAYQLAQLFPSALEVLGPMMNYDPLIFKKSLQVQLLSLFVRPLQHLVQLGSISDNPQSPRVFLIDGLDECNDSVQQQAIIKAIATVCHEHHIPVKFIIASRPEQAISSSFEWYKEENRVLGATPLSEDPDAETDIRCFIEDEFQRIRLRHTFKQMIPAEWPKLYDISRLVWKSSSHFIYASTAMKYIWSVKESPIRSLQVVLGLEVSRTISPFAELDALYRHILGTAAHRDKVLQILVQCLISSKFSWLGDPKLSLIGSVCAILDYSLDDLLIYMADMTPLVTFKLSPAGSTSGMQRENIQLLHASLGDFLNDQSRSGSLYVSQAAYLASKLERCIQLLHFYSQQQQPCPEWPERPEFYESMRPSGWLIIQIIRTIEISGHLVVTQKVLSRYSLRNFHECLLLLQPVHQGNDYTAEHCIEFLAAVHAIGTSNGLRLYRSCLEDFFDIVEPCINLDNKKLGPSILPLVFVGCPIEVVHTIILYHHYGPLYRFMVNKTYINNFKTQVSIGDIITTADLSSIRHSIYAAPQPLAVAAEVILQYLAYEVELVRPLTSPKHKLAWVQRPKPQNRIATDYLTSPWTPATFYTMKNLVLNLLNALLWVIPKAGFSEEILLYSKRSFSQFIYQGNVRLVHRVRKRLDEYTTRVRKEKLKELGQRIENGDVNALVEKSRMLYLDGQD